MWEDGFCRGRVTDCLEEIEGEHPVRKAFSKMSIQLYNYGEGWVLGRCFCGGFNYLSVCMAVSKILQKLKLENKKRRRRIRRRGYYGDIFGEIFVIYFL